SSCVWTGTLTPPETGEYRLMIQAWRGAATLFLDGGQLGSAASPRDGFARKWSSIVPTTDGLDNELVTVTLTGGRAYPIRIALTGWADTVHDRGPVEVRLAWVTPEQRAADIRAAASL
ncbi:PA14 domain-containing protein, partial [Streptomyces sp. TRM76130]|nr:PA14 domain-containing protein [Streptomyces sp. TRM76130]